VAFNKEKVMEAARKFVDKGQVDKAVKEYLRVVKEDPQDVRVWLKIGDLYAKKGAKQEASETYLKVARFYQDQGFFLKAVAVYKQILKLDPRLVEVNLKLAELYRQLGLLSDAMQHFESVAAHFHREGKTKEALATVRQLVDLDPENIATRIKLAELYSKEGMNGEAVAEFSVACDQLRKQARVDDFVKVAERLLWHKADNLPLNRELAVLYLRRNDPRRALQKLQACFKADPRDVETLALLAQAFQALDQKSKTVSVLKELARVFDENKQREKAEEVHRKILQFVPNDPDSLAYLGEKAGKPALTPPGEKFKPVITPAPQTGGPVGRGTGGQPRLNFTSEINAVAPPVSTRMTGAMPLVQASDFELPDYEEQAIEEGDAGDFSEELSLDDGVYADGRTSSVAGEEHAEEISKILTETDVYIKYGLHQKAIDHLRRVFALDGENLEARERLKDVLLSQGREREAIGELMRLAEGTAKGDPDRAEVYLREVLGIDGTYKPAFDLARRYKLDLAGAGRPPAEVDLDSESLAAGGIAPVDEEPDFDDLDFGEASSKRNVVGVARADSFDGIDPQMFQAAHHRVGLAAEARPPGPQEKTRQIASSEVEALAAMTNAPNSLEFEDGVVETPPPPIMPGASWRPNQRSLDDVLDEHLDDALGEDIDQDVAAELGSQARAVGSPPEGFHSGAYDLGYDSGDVVAEELEFDPAEARAFDQGIGGIGALRPGTPKPRVASAFGDSPETFDPAAAAAFDADRPEDLRLRVPKAADFGAAPSEPFDEMGLGGGVVADDAVPADDEMIEEEEPGFVHDAPSSTLDLGTPDQLAALAQSYDGAYTVDAPLDTPEAPYAAAYDSATVDAPYDEAGAAPEYAPPPRAASSLEDDLDEVDFYVGQDMLVEAADLLRSLLTRHPGHPLITAKLRDVEGHGGGGVPEYAPPDEEVDDDQVVAASGGTQNIDIDEIEELEPDDLLEDEAAKSKKTRKPAVVLEKPIDDGDAETHYDLGLAYKEMGLWDEAVKAFEKLSGNSARVVQCKLMIGLCRREQGNFSEAIHAFKAGLHAPQVTDREKQSLFYEIGVAYEAMGDAREALYYFEMVTKRDPAFLDANDRVTRLRNGNRGRPEAVGDEF
jgi:tetratricopeptide (TPR) repeat protein